MADLLFRTLGVVKPLENADKVSDTKSRDADGCHRQSHHVRIVSAAWNFIGWNNSCHLHDMYMHRMRVTWPSLTAF